MRAISWSSGAMKRAPAALSAIVVKPGPPGAAAPQSRGAPVEYHGGPVAGAVEVNGLEIPLGIEPNPVEYRARQQDEPGAAGAEGDGLAAQIPDRAAGTVGAYYEETRRRIHGGDDPEPPVRAPGV